MFFNEPKFNGIAVPVTVCLVLLWASACNNEQAPSFAEQRSGTYDITVVPSSEEDADATGDAASAEEITPEVAAAILAEVDTPVGEDGQEIRSQDSENPSGSKKDKGQGNKEDATSQEESGEESTENSEEEAGESSSEESADDASPATKKEIAACAKLAGTSPDRVKTVSSKNPNMIQANSTIAIRITGNQREVNLNLNGDSELKIRGVCVFAAGNKPRFTMQNSIPLETFVYVGRGNMSVGSVVVPEESSIGKVFGSLSGNKAQLSITGAGEYPCDGVLQKGNESSFVCE